MKANRKLDVMIAEALGWKRICLSEDSNTWLCRPQSLDMITKTFTLKKTKAGKLDPDCQYLTTNDWALKVPNFSTDIASAWLVVIAMAERGHRLICIEDLTCDESSPTWGADFGKYQEGKSAAVAICLAALVKLYPSTDFENDDHYSFLDTLRT